MADQEHEPIPINIGNICGGAIVEAFAIELDKVLKNIMDPNTEARAKRVISFDVLFAPKDDRVTVNTEFSCKTKLAGLIPSNQKIFVGKDAEGTLYALDEDPRQMQIFTAPKPIEAPAPIPFSGTSGKRK